MVMKTVIFDEGNAYLFKVHIDTTKIQNDGSPDPAWVLEYRWCKEPPEGQSLQEYLATCKREAELLAALDPRLQPAPQEMVLP